MNTVKSITSADEFNDALKSVKKELAVVHFWAPWAEQCALMNEAMEELTREFPRGAHFFKLEAEELPEISQKYEIVAVPTILFFKNSQKIDRLDGAHVPELERLIEKNLDAIALSWNQETEDLSLDEKLKQLINSHKCMLFMKGDPETPKCGFSKQTVALLQKHNCDFRTFDILEDPDVRQGLKDYSKWPTYPQLYIDGSLIGGLDILKEMDEDGELTESLPKVVAKPPLEERLKKLIESEKIILFMKGEPSTPRCGFSRQMVGILNEIGTSYGHFDILTDDEVRQGLKKYSNWPTYPQLYVKGNLVGGLDIIKEMKEDGELEDMLSS